jgi:nitrite reductase/ring-hydroxylating ferredoxin subunit
VKTANLEELEMVARRSVFAIVALAGLSLLAACSAAEGPASPGGSAAPGAPSSAGPIEGTWVDVNVSGDSVAVPLSLVEEKLNTHFSVMQSDQRLDFMAYLLDGTLYVRANACPPCRSRGFALDGDVLVCDTCGTTFRAKDGNGIQGACVDYPKASAAYTVEEGVVRMSLADLGSAYAETLVRG